MGRLSILLRRRQNIPPPLAFHIAVACSWWAYRVGVAKLQVHRGSVVQCVGRREHWLEIDPRALREWAMAPLVITLGLRPIDLSEAARIPIRVEVEGILREDNILPPGIVYVDRGHHSHRLSVIQWVSPFVRVTLMVLTSGLLFMWNISFPVYRASCTPWRAKPWLVTVPCLVCARATSWLVSCLRISYRASVSLWSRNWSILRRSPIFCNGIGPGRLIGTAR